MLKVPFPKVIIAVDYG